jgi:hypothetical protein
MRTLTVAAGLMLAIGVAATARAQEPLVWQGDEFQTAVSSTCTAANITTVGDFNRIVYRPFIAGSADNLSPDGLLLVSSRSAILLEAAKTTLRGKADAIETALGSHAGASQNATTVDLKITPSKITDTTPVVLISGVINDYFNVQGCNITVNGSLVPRPAE